jgi:hypothetical protein
VLGDVAHGPLLITPAIIEVLFTFTIAAGINEFPMALPIQLICTSTSHKFPHAAQLKVKFWLEGIVVVDTVHAGPLQFEIEK